MYNKVFTLKPPAVDHSQTKCSDKLPLSYTQCVVFLWFYYDSYRPLPVFHSVFMLFILFLLFSVMGIGQLGYWESWISTVSVGLSSCLSVCLRYPSIITCYSGEEWVGCLPKWCNTGNIVYTVDNGSVCDWSEVASFKMDGGEQSRGRGASVARTWRQQKPRNL